MQDKGLITVENAQARHLLDMVQRAKKLRYLWQIFCLPVFKVSNIYWFIYGKDNRN
jgi:hypothetical protein